MREKVRRAVLHELVTLYEKAGLGEADLPNFAIETPPEDKFGDYSTNAAMLSAKPLKNAPRKIAEQLLPALKENLLFDNVAMAGPGFINFFIKRAEWAEEFKGIPDDGSDYGTLAPKPEGKCLIEFVSANPTGPLHIGHGRGAAFGDALARVMKKAGYDVTREYYLNDAGNQMANLGLSTIVRYRQLLGQLVDFPENGYQGEYITEIAREVIEKEGDRHLSKTDEELLEHFSSFTGAKVLDGIKEDLERFRVSFDNWVSERSFHDGGMVEQTLAELEAHGAVFAEDGALWLKTADAGDEKNRVVKRANGLTTYLAADIAYHHDKYRRGYEKLIDIWGADHHGYVARMKAAVTALGKSPDTLVPLLIQLVSLKRAGEIVAMSTRKATFTTLREVLNEVGEDAARFFFLTRSNDSHLEFDLDLAKEQSSENPVYYIQYAHARICNIFKTATERGVSLPGDDVPWDRLDLPEEVNLMKKALAFPELVGECARTLAPHPLTHYLLELAGMFHRYYKGNRVVDDNLERSRARLAFVARLRTVIANGLHLLGVSTPEKM